MPTAKPRLMISLDPSVLACYVAFGKAQERPTSTAISEFLTEMAPSIEALGRAIEHEKAGRRVQAKRALAQFVGDQMAEIITATQREHEQRPLKGLR